MYMHGITIKLDPALTPVCAAEDEWSVGGHYMTHIPTSVTFLVDIDEGKENQQMATMMDFNASPMHICHGHVIPKAEELTDLGRQAIVLHLHVIGALELDVLEETNASIQ